MSPVEAAVTKSDTFFINSMIVNCVSCFSGCVSALETHDAVYTVHIIVSQHCPKGKHEFHYVIAVSALQEPWTKCLFTFIFWSSTSLGWPGDLCRGFIFFSFWRFLFFPLFYAGSYFALRHPCMFPVGFNPFNGNYEYASKGKIPPSGIYSASMCKHNSH